MPSFEFSLIHASYKSLGQARKVRDRWLSMAKFPELVEHCLSFESTDDQVRIEFELSQEASGISKDGLTKYRVTDPGTTPSAIRNWNTAAKLSSGNFLLVIADDLVPNKDWDEQLLKIISYERHYPRLWLVTDERCSRRGDRFSSDILPRHPLVTRALYESYGFIFDPKYLTVGPDDEWLLQGLKNNFIRDAREIEFHHSIGKLFDSQLNLLCGCFGEKSVSTRSESQIKIHNEEWVSVARKNLKNWGFFWEILGSLSTAPRLSNEILRLSLVTDSPDFRAQRIMMKLFFSNKVFLSDKWLIAKRLLTVFL